MQANSEKKNHFQANRLPEIARQFEREKRSLRQLAENADCSHETVRKELINYFGNSSYQEILNRRAAPKEKNPVRILDVGGARALLKGITSKTYTNEEKMLLSKVLLQAKKAGVKLSVIAKSDAPFDFMLADGRTIKIKLARPDGSDREHLLGLHRFRLNRSISAYDFAVFAAADNNNQAIYVFRVSEVRKIKSLVLRYNWLERESKYSYARDRWSILVS